MPENGRRSGERERVPSVSDASSLSPSLPFFGFSLVASLLGLALACLLACRCKFVIDEGEEERDGRGGGFDRGDGVVVAMAAVEERREQVSNR